MFESKRFASLSLHSMTLDQDDARIASAFLKNRSSWSDPAAVLEYGAAFRRWNGSKHAFAFMSGREALSGCIAALRLEAGDEVILPGYTCVVVPNAFHYTGIQTVYADIELDSYGLDAASVESKITSKTKAILLHHLYGLVSRDYANLLNLARRRRLKVIEDCAHAAGAEYKGLKVGNQGDAAFYSSEESKVFNTIHGGMATTNDDEIGRRLKAHWEQCSYPDEAWIDRQLCQAILSYYENKHALRRFLGPFFKIKHGRKRLDSVTWEEEHGIRPSYYGRKMPAPIAALGLNQLKKIGNYSGTLLASPYNFSLRRENENHFHLISGGVPE